MYSQTEVFFRILSFSVSPLCRIPFIVTLKYIKKINTRLSSQNLNSEKQSNLLHSGTPWDILKHNLGRFELYFFQNFMFKFMLLKLPTRFCPPCGKTGHQSRQEHNINKISYVVSRHNHFFSCDYNVTHDHLNNPQRIYFWKK